jgi:hypothetical protein
LGQLWYRNLVSKFGLKMRWSQQLKMGWVMGTKLKNQNASELLNSLSLVGILVLILAFAFPQTSMAQTDPSTPSSAAAAAAAQAAAVQANARQQALMVALYCFDQCYNHHNNAGCYLGMLALQQANSLGATSAGATDNSQNLSTNGGGTTAPAGPYGAGITYASVQEAAQKAGVSVAPDGKSGTMPDGTVVPINGSSASDAGMRSAGLTDSQIAQAKALSDELKDKLGKNGNSGAGAGAFAGGGGGGGGAMSRPPPDAAPTSVLAGSRKKPNVSGMTKNFGKDKIGVAGDNIFEMVSRRYKSNTGIMKQ